MELNAGASASDSSPASSNREISEVMSSTSKQVYTPEEVSALLGMHPNSVYASLKSGDLPGIKVGRKWLISKKRFEKWLDGVES